MSTRRIVGATLLALLLAVSAVDAAESGIRVGLVFDGPWAGNQMIRELTATELDALVEGEFDIEIRDRDIWTGDWSVGGVERAVEGLLDDPDVDLVITWGVLASHVVSARSDLPKPVVAPAVIDATVQDLPEQNGVSGVRNLSYVTLPDYIWGEIGTFRQIVPFKKVAFLANRAISTGIPSFRTRSTESVRELGIDVVFVDVDFQAAPAVEAIPDDVDAVYVWPQLQLSDVELRHLADGLIERKLPAFSSLSGKAIEYGLLASVRSADFFPRLARRVALNVQRILLGEKPESLPVAFNTRPSLILNMKTARAIDVSPRWEILLEAELLHVDDVEGRETLDLETVMRHSMESNLGLAVERSAVAGGLEDVKIAESHWRPQLESSLTGLVIDEERAAASFGSQAEESLTLNATVSQLLWSEPAAANLAIQKRMHEGRVASFGAARLDVAAEAAVTYLNLLRAKTLQTVRRNNLRLTRTNLELARVRRAIGTANPAEVYRWEAEIAGDRKDLFEANAMVRVAEIALNRVLNHDLEMQFDTAPVDLSQPGMIVGHSRFGGYIATPKHFRILRDFTVEEGLGNSFEVAALRAAVTARHRQLRMTERAFWSPEVGAQFSIDEKLVDGGAGTAGGLLDLSVDDTTWSFGLSASLELFTGGRRKAELRQAEAALEEAQRQLESAEQQISESIRGSMMEARASFTGIRLAEEAATAASKSLDLVSDAYARGAVSILDLLDAQNIALNADLAAANAIYDFLIDLMRVQRGTSRFHILDSSEEQAAWYQRLEDYFAAAGVAPWPSE